MLTNQKQVLKQAAERKGQRPHDWLSREEAFLRFMMAWSEAKQHEKGYSSYVPTAYLPSTTPLAQLRDVRIRELQLETHHRGMCLFARVITPPQRLTAIMVLVEDDREHAVLLQLYQQEEEASRRAADMFDTGTILLVKEPYLKVMADGGYGLRVDHLSDVVHLREDEPRIPAAWRTQSLEEKRSAEALKLKGNAFVKEGKYWQAISEYSKALVHGATVDESKAIKCNRALAYLKTEQFDAALPDTGYPVTDHGIAEKALFRAAEALYGLERYSECRVVLQLLCKRYPDKKCTAMRYDRARARCSEQNTGNYDFKLLQAEAEEQWPPRLDHATYVGPVTIKKAGDKGRGLFITDPVKAGDLLLCEKAFSCAHAAKDGGSNSRIAKLINPETDEVSLGGQSDLLRITALKLQRNPSAALPFTALHHGAYEAASTRAVDGRPVVDTFLVEQIMSFNSFGYPRVSSRHAHKAWIEGKEQESAVYQSCGIWVEASYINHSCTSNARRSFIGDMMVVRASEDLEPGTEVTFRYLNPDGNDFNALQEKLSHWAFTCTCAVCEDARQTKPYTFAERHRLLEKMQQILDSSGGGMQTDEMERLLEDLGNTYARPADEVPRFLLWEQQLLLTRVYMERNDAAKGVESVRKILVALGFVVAGADTSPAKFRVLKWGMLVDNLVEVFLHARTAFEVLGRREDSRRAVAYAKVAYKILVGEDSSFESLYGVQ